MATKKASAAKVKSWRDVLKVHPACELFPPLPPDELRALGEDIKANGLQQPIKVIATPRTRSRTDRLYNVKYYDLAVLDGRSRLDAMALVGADIEEILESNELNREIFDVTEVFHIDAVAYVISANMRRRHLTTQQKRDLIAALLKAKPERSNNATGKIVGADGKTVASVRHDMEGRSEIPTVDKTTDTRGREQPTHQAHKPKKPSPAVQAAADRAEASAAKRTKQTKIKQTDAVSAEATAALRKELYDDTPSDGPQDFWQRSLAYHAGEAVALRAFWTKEYPGWENFAVPAELATLARQAAQAWAAVAEHAEWKSAGGSLH
jgi:hypothetical protein